ncbi:MAG: MoxR family ATPase [Chloroflexi bacterium]|nr:MoxR family ATPase [Chloroflexota bacterium]
MDQDTRSHATQIAGKIIKNVKLVIIGKDAAIERSLVTLMCRGHALVEDVPGVGKTMLARSLAVSIGCAFKRIQFTPDLLPSDIVGVSIYNQHKARFEFSPGPIVSQVVLADEINRATPKTQSALLEAMEERQVTVGGETFSLPAPFFVIATQNPIEYEGTFPLPEAQLDRFLQRISLGYPSLDEELRMISSQENAHPIETLRAVATPEEVVSLQEAVKGIHVDDKVRNYIVSVLQCTRNHPDISLGASPRATLNLFRACQALAMLRDRDYVIPDDVKELANGLLGHRLVVSHSARMHGTERSAIIAQILNSVAVPGTIWSSRR